MDTANTLNLVRTKNKMKSFFIYIFMAISLLAIGGGIYYAIFTPDHLSQETTEQKPIPAETLLQEPVPNDTPAIRIDENVQPTTTPPTEQNVQSLVDETAENSLPISDMQEPVGQTTQAPKTTDDTLKTTPPDDDSIATNFVIPSNTELEAQKERENAEKLRMLQEAKKRRIQLAENEKKILPGANKRLGLSNLTASKLTQDPVITDVFIQKLAEIFMNNYNLNDNGVGNSYGLSAMKISQHFGVTMEGLVHPQGRQGIFEYIYQPKMIQTLSQFVEPRLISKMTDLARTKGFNQEQEREMFHYYAALAKNTATMLDAIISTTFLDRYIGNFIKIEKKLNKKKKEFANALIDFEITKQEKRDTKGLEAKLSQFSREANAIEKNLLSSRNTILSNISKNTPILLDQNELFDLALWVERRKNKTATRAAMQSLYKISSLLSVK